MDGDVECERNALRMQGIQRAPSPGSRSCDDARGQRDHTLCRGLGFDLVGRGIVRPVGCLPWTAPASALSPPDLAITRARVLKRRNLPITLEFGE